MVQPPLARLVGLETEYAIRFAPVHQHPGNDVIFEALRAALSRRVAARPGESAPGRDQFFVENGGAFYYEFLPHCLWGGLIEGATPECRGPGQLLLYQKAQEALLEDALPAAAEELSVRGYPGHLGLLKNSRDALGNVYGSQENYEAELASGPGLFLYRLGVVALLPVLALLVLLTYALVVVIIAVLVLSAFVIPFVPPWRRRFMALIEDHRALEGFLGSFHLWLVVVLTWPVTTPFAALLRWTGFRRLRRRTEAFLVTRPVFSGCGSVEIEDGRRRFRLSEKGSAIKRVIRATILPSDRPIFDTGNLIKMMCAPFNLQLRPLARLFHRRQRLQLGYGDSNLAQVAEYLRVGTTALVIDMVEAGALDDAPRLEDPLAALGTVIDDPSLTARLPLQGGALQDGGEASALEIQRFYLERAKQFVRDSPATSLEAREVVRRWEETLDVLGSGDLGSLVGRLDWITKRFLLERCGGDDADEDTLKTLDLRYHELGDGYFARLAEAGEVAELVTPEEIRRAMHDPPEDTPAFLRGGLIRRQAGSDVPLYVSWDSATLGRRLGGKVIPFRRPR